MQSQDGGRAGVEPALELARLRAEVARLRQQAKNAASANVRAALQLAELNELRRLESEARERELSRALAQARDAALKKDEFLAKVSHELRTPLNGIVGMTTLLLDSELEEEQRGYAEAALHAGRALAELIEDLLDLSKLEAAQLKLVSLEFDLWQVVEEVARMLATRAGQEIELRIAIDPAVERRFIGDPYRLRQVLSNLVGNAIKFTEEGHVTVRVEAADTDFGARMLRVWVEDTGCGIPEGSIPLLFESFRQLDDSPQRRHGGTGLGLAISKALVECMGGHISAESELGRGSTFSFSLPLVPAPVEQRPPPLQGMRALAATRNEHCAQVLRAHLAATGAEVALERDLLRSVERLGAETFDLVIVDGGSYSDQGTLRALRAVPTRARAALIAPPAPRAPAEPPRGTRVLSSPLAPSDLQGFALDASLRGERETRFEDARQRLAAVIGRREVRVLVVEDNRINQVVARKMLERLGCSVEVASDGSSAIELVAARAYDLVFMDCPMPGIDGYAATHAIREREGAGAARTTIVALTAQALEADRERCLAAGMDDYLAKPIQLEALVDLLAARLAGGGLSQAS